MIFYSEGFFILDFLFSRLFNCLKSNTLKVLHSKSVETIAIPPPIKAEKKGVNIYKHILEIKLPSKLQGAIINVYLKDVINKLIFKFGTVFLIFFKFNKDIVVIDRKNETITLLMPIIGVNIIKLTNKTIDPKM